MFVYRTRKIKIPPINFVSIQLDEFFGNKNEAAIHRSYNELAEDYNFLKEIPFKVYFKEMLNVQSHLFGIAWDRTITPAQFTKHAGLPGQDSRVRRIESGAYQNTPSEAREGGMGTFEYVASVFLKRLSPHIDINDPQTARIGIEYTYRFSSLYDELVAHIKWLKF